MAVVVAYIATLEFFRRARDKGFLSRGDEDGPGRTGFSRRTADGEIRTLRIDQQGHRVDLLRDSLQEVFQSEMSATPERGHSNGLCSRYHGESSRTHCAPPKTRNLFLSVVNDHGQLRSYRVDHIACIRPRTETFQPELRFEFSAEILSRNAFFELTDPR